MSNIENNYFVENNEYLPGHNKTVKIQNHMNQLVILISKIGIFQSYSSKDFGHIDANPIGYTWVQ